MKTVTIDGNVYNIVERLGFNHGVGLYAMIVQDGDQEPVVVKDGGGWRFWKAADKLRPGGRMAGQ